MLKCILRRNPDQRYNINQILEHPAIQSRMDDFNKPISEDQFILMMTSYMQNCGMSTKRDHPEEIKKYKASNKAFENDFYGNTNDHNPHSFFDDITVQIPSSSYYGPMLTPFFGNDPGFFDNVNPANFKKSKVEVKQVNIESEKSQRGSFGVSSLINPSAQVDLKVSEVFIDNKNPLIQPSLQQTSRRDSGGNQASTRDVLQVSSREITYSNRDIGQFSNREIQQFTAHNQGSNTSVTKKNPISFPEHVDTNYAVQSQKSQSDTYLVHYTKIPETIASNNTQYANPEVIKTNSTQYVNTEQIKSNKTNPLMSETAFFNIESHQQRESSGSGKSSQELKIQSGNNIQLLYHAPKSTTEQDSGQFGQMKYQGSPPSSQTNIRSNAYPDAPVYRMVSQEVSNNQPTSNYQQISTEPVRSQVTKNTTYQQAEIDAQAKNDENVRYFPYEIQDGNHSMVINTLHDQFNKMQMNNSNKTPNFTKHEFNFGNDKVPIKTTNKNDLKSVIAPDSQKLPLDNIGPRVQGQRASSNVVQFVNYHQFNTSGNGFQSPTPRNINPINQGTNKQTALPESSLTNTQGSVTNTQGSVINAQPRSTGIVSSNYAPEPSQSKGSNVKYVDYFVNRDSNPKEDDHRNKGFSLGSNAERGYNEIGGPGKTIKIYKPYVKESSVEKRSDTSPERSKYTGHPYFIPHQMK